MFTVQDLPAQLGIGGHPRWRVRLKCLGFSKTLAAAVTLAVAATAERYPHTQLPLLWCGPATATAKTPQGATILAPILSQHPGLVPLYLPLATLLQSGTAQHEKGCQDLTLYFLVH